MVVLFAGSKGDYLFQDNNGINWTCMHVYSIKMGYMFNGPE